MRSEGVIAMDFGTLAENKIREAQQQGVFDHLARKGQMEFEDESGIPEDMRLALRMLKSQGLTPDWIEQDKHLRQKLDDARAALARSWAWRKKKLAQTIDPSERGRVNDEWQRARARFEAVVQEINAEIFTFNLRAPSLAVQRRPVRSSEEYRALGIEG
jgi:DnaJ family protein C protein 28